MSGTITLIGNIVIITYSWSSRIVCHPRENKLHFEKHQDCRKIEIVSACLFLKETSKCWSLKISVFQGNTTASFQSISSSSPSCSADKQFHPAFSVKWKLERGICGLVLKSWCLQKKRAAFVSQHLMQSHAGVRGTPCRNKSLHKQMSLLVVLSALHVDKEIF